MSEQSPNPDQEASPAEPTSWLRYRRIGAYEVLGELGQGGTGQVLLGMRDDDTRKQVAIKVLKRGMDSREILARFYQERTILASLNHPFIARLYDVGCTDDGLPYFVMEYVDGLSLIRYAGAQSLNVNARLKLFLRICEAVNYAHQKLVVHRDLKPANILVTREGDPKLLDFGIAGLINNEQQATAVTVYHQRMLTLEYASPEQLRGEPLGTTTDVYSMGVILYELLTGKRPFRFKGQNAAEAAAVLSDQTRPPRPSTTQPRRKLSTLERKQISDAFKGSWYRNFMQHLRGNRIDRDLDRIVLKALSVQREERYASIEDFAADIRRYLRGLPIKARPRSWSYRIGRFLTRNRLTIIATGLAAGLVLGSTVQAWQKRQEAALRRDETERLVTFMTELFQLDGSVDDYGDQVPAKRLLDRAAVRLGGELEDFRDTRGMLRVQIGRAYDGLGLYRDAWMVYNQALEDLETAHGPRAEPVADVLVEASLLASEGQPREVMREMLERALAIYTERYGEDHERVWQIVSLLGYHYQIIGELTQAEYYYRRSYEGRKRWLGEDHPDLIDSVNQLSIIAMHKSDCEAAASGFKRVIEHSTEHDGPMSRDTVAVIGNLALVYRECGQYELAIEGFREQLRRSRRIYRPSHPYLAASLIFLADALRADQQYAEAELLLQEALDGLAQSLRADHNYFARARLILGGVYIGMGRYDQAEEELRKTLEINVNHFGPEHYRVARTRLALADLAYRRGSYGEAENHARQSLEIFVRLYGPQYFRTAYARALLGTCLAQAGRTEEGGRLALEGYRQLLSHQPEGEFTRMIHEKLAELQLL
ncbi:serine/threonine-protein kinase [Acanthopleuribacter pedis]|uniref:Serine/threonine protein kinase n=1 Tax=Acanthopleuribacter pedis TaxID=442870 RepID=A0A8J7U3V4_9BACT|nr:serine/threonine-protein kinase [Acanthopleuribacter pedis]MBO1320838.1 serine/threonine protein kinase [Acanthopleuribacter pedis]